MQPQERPTPSDEIDLSRLFSKIGDLFRGIGTGFIRFLALLRSIPLRNKLLFSVVIVTTIVCSIFYGLFLKKKFYESTMIINSAYLNKRIIDNTIEKLNLLAEEKNKSGLAKLLNLNDSVAAKISKFEAKPFVAETDVIELEVLKEQLKSARDNSKNPGVIDQVIQRIEIENRHAFEITVRTFSPTVIVELQSALVNFLRNNDYVKKRIEINRQGLLQRKEKLLIESGKLDSLKELIYANYKSMAEKERQGSNNVILSDRSITNPIDVYGQSILIYNEIQSIDRELHIQSDFEVVDGFTEFSEPASASLSKMVAQAFILGIGIAYLLVALGNLNTYLSDLD